MNIIINSKDNPPTLKISVSYKIFSVNIVYYNELITFLNAGTRCWVTMILSTQSPINSVASLFFIILTIYLKTRRHYNEKAAARKFILCLLACLHRRAFNSNTWIHFARFTWTEEINYNLVFLSLQINLKVLDQKFFFYPWTQNQCAGRCAITVLRTAIQHVEWWTLWCGEK